MNKVLLVEDDQRLSEHLMKLLQDEGFAVETAASFQDLDAYIESRESFQSIILDRLLHQKDSKEKMSSIKKKWPQASLLILSAINTPMERAELIELGADDYIGKPFLSQELLARLKSLQRRSSYNAQNYRQLGNTILDLHKRSLSVGAHSSHLTSKEFLVLRLLTDDTGRVYSKNNLLDLVWGTNSPDTNVVESTITNLRRRLTEAGSDLEIKNMRNSGYWIEA